MTREQYMNLFGFTEFDAGMEYADEEVANGATWEQIAESTANTIELMSKY